MTVIELPSHGEPMEKTELSRGRGVLPEVEMSSMLGRSEGCELSADWAQQARNVNGQTCAAALFGAL